MLSSIPLLALLVVQLTPVAKASPIPIPQNPPDTNAPAGPPITSGSDLSASLGDLVIPQKEEAANLTTSTNTPPPAVNEERSAPVDLSRLVEDIGDFRLPSNVTAGHVVQAAKRAVPTLSEADVSPRFS